MSFGLGDIAELAGKVLGGVIGGPAGAMIGQMLGQMIGDAITGQSSDLLSGSGLTSMAQDIFNASYGGGFDIGVQA